MHKIHSYSLYLFFTIALSSCGANIGVYENIFFKNDGSGTCKISLDLRDSATTIKLGDYMVADKSQRTQVIAYRGFEDSGRKLGYIKGISNISIAYDAKMLYLELKFQFKDLDSLNKAMNVINGQENRNVVYFGVDKQSLIRMNTKSVSDIVDRLYKKDDSKVASYGLKNFFKGSTYVTTYLFETKISSYTNKLAKVSEDGKEIKLKCHIVSQDELTVGNKISLSIQPRK